MQVIPAIDLREGACVQLVGGSYAEERVRLTDPVGVAERWEKAGFRRLHLVDLDAATGKGDNRALVAELIGKTGMTVQCGGGIRDFDSIEDILSFGAAAVVLGTRALENRVWLEEAASRFPRELIVAADVRERRIVTRGWTRELQMDAVRAVRELRDLPLAAVLVTAVHREGLMEGPDLELMRDLLEVTDLPLQASGGISDVADLEKLEELGVSSAIVGMALYTGTLDATKAREFSK